MSTSSNQTNAPQKSTWFTLKGESTSRHLWLGCLGNFSNEPEIISCDCTDSIHQKCSRKRKPSYSYWDRYPDTNFKYLSLLHPSNGLESSFPECRLSNLRNSEISSPPSNYAHLEGTELKKDKLRLGSKMTIVVCLFATSL